MERFVRVSPVLQHGIGEFLGGGFKYFYFHPDPWGKIPILTVRIFFKWAATTCPNGLHKKTLRDLFRQKRRGTVSVTDLRSKDLSSCHLPNRRGGSLPWLTTLQILFFITWDPGIPFFTMKKNPMGGKIFPRTIVEP